MHNPKGCSAWSRDGEPRPHCPLYNRNRGTYVLMLALQSSCALTIGKARRCLLQAGGYAYVGSALGSGGLGARLRHHLRPLRRPHWHIDYLRRVAVVGAVWWSADERRREHEWATLLLRLPGAGGIVPGFGASDCRCRSHLVYFPEPPSLALFQQECVSHSAATGSIHEWKVCAGVAAGLDGGVAHSDRRSSGEVNFCHAPID